MQHKYHLAGVEIRNDNAINKQGNKPGDGCTSSIIR